MGFKVRPALVTDAGSRVGIPTVGVAGAVDIDVVGGGGDRLGNGPQSHGDVDDDDHHCSYEAQHVEHDSSDVAPQGVGATAFGLVVLASVVMLLPLAWSCDMGKI